MLSWGIAVQLVEPLIICVAILSEMNQKQNGRLALGRVHLLSSELEKTVRRPKTSGTMTTAVPADARMPIIRVE
jgi:hypothetical protein